VIGVPGLRLPRVATLIFAAAFLVLAGALGALYLWSPRATIRITAGPEGGPAQRFIGAVMADAKASYPRVRFEAVTVPDLVGSARALEEGRADIAIVRSDYSPPANGATLVILRRDAAVIALPPKSPIDEAAKLAGKTVAIPQGPAQEANAHLLDLILGYYNLPPGSVKHVFLPLADIGEALRRRQAAAAFGVGPIGPGEATDVVAAIAKAFKANPVLLALDEAEAMGKRIPGLESLDIPEGGLKARPPLPDDSLTTVAVTYRLVVPATMLKPVAGLLARSILKSKTRLMKLSPFANQIEAPDPDAEDPVLPIHPGVVDYLSSGDQSFFDDAQQYLYLVGIPFSLAASLIAVFVGWLRNRKLVRDQQDVTRLLVIADEAESADEAELATLEREFRKIVASCVGKLLQGAAADQTPVTLSIDHARRSIAARRTALGLTSKAG
jgi:TRAP-type uncharacterized transport system substrate-binding protein